MVTYMKVLEAYTNIVYENFRTQDYDYWSFGNQILYDMCLKNPSHTNENVIIGKIWLIGRSYAAAIERIKEKSVPSDDFYSDVVAPHFLQFGVELDDKLKYLKSTTEVSLDNLQEILYVHKFLVNQITEITKLEKHSLASKYLHFHLPNHFFIYDSRAAGSITRFVHKERKEILLEGDEVYVDFCMRAMQLRKYIFEKYGEKCSPRDIDNFLLYENKRRLGGKK